MILSFLPFEFPEIRLVARAFVERDRRFKRIARSPLVRRSLWLREVKNQRRKGRGERGGKNPRVYTSCKYPCQKNLSKTSPPCWSSKRCANTFPVVSLCSAEGLTLLIQKLAPPPPRPCPLSPALTLSIKRVGEGAARKREEDRRRG